jgi:aspartate 1-decarboxylase
MKIELLKSKIHRATVTDANLDYVGSLTLDPMLMEGANLNEYEKIHVLNITNGSRLITYIIKGERGSGEVCINGAAAHLVSKGDLVIVASYCILSENDAKAFKPRIVHVDNQNNIIS